MGLTLRCLDELFAQRVDEFADIVVVDDGSEADLTVHLAAFGAPLRTVRQQESEGFAAACNRGAAQSTTETLLFLNNDVFPLPGWLDEMHAELAAHPDAGIVGARLMYLDGSVQHAGMCIRSDGFPANLYVGLPGAHPAVRRCRRLQAVTGACLLVRRALFERLGGFDEAYLNGGEDVDLCLRANEIGATVRYCGRAGAHHLEEITRSGAEMPANEQLFMSRWQGKLHSDELDLLVEDGLLEVSRDEDNLVRLTLSSLVGAASLRLDEDIDATLDRARQMLSLTRENHRLRVRHLEQAADQPIEIRPPGPRVAVSGREPPRVNVIVSGTALRSTLHRRSPPVELARALQRRGRRARLLVTDPAGRDDRFSFSDPRSLGPEGVMYIDDAEAVVFVSPKDRFVAADWASATVAAKAARLLGQDRFVYLRLDDECQAVPASGSEAALARAALALPHHAVVSSPLLEAGDAPGQERSVVLEDPLTDVHPQHADDLSAVDPVRVLVKPPRPWGGTHTLFGLANLALQEAVAGGLPGGPWRFTAADGAQETSIVRLGRGAQLVCLGGVDERRYRGLLRTNDIGLAPSASRHPGAPVLEMARAGMIVVTTTATGKSAASLSALSRNIIAVDATPAALAAGLGEAYGRLSDIQGRMRSTAVRYRAWDGLDEDAVSTVDALLDDVGGSG